MYMNCESLPCGKINRRLAGTHSATFSASIALNYYRRINMATTMYFNEVIRDQGGKISMEVEFGRSSFYPEDSIYLVIDGKTVIMNQATAKRFVEAVAAVGRYHGFVD
jgi:hypothetical protein